MNIKIEVIEFKTEGITYTFKKDIWIEDKFHLDGGYYLAVDQTYEKPRINVAFRARAVDSKLLPGSVYSDKNSLLYYAISDETVLLADCFVVSFTIPDEIHPIGSANLES